MSRGKLRSAVEVCADCGSHDPTWASINRGILLCSECCSVHRTLGRHISQVKCLKKDTWSPSQLAMVHTLHTSGANNIWEHSMLDPTNAKSGRRKPNPKDPVNPIKADFIRTKHQNLGFVYRPNKDDTQMLEGDISKQLHSCVRTANLETCLRLLSLGADPNYFHLEKGIRPIHVAAKAGQASQVELLVVYGADPGACDWEGVSPVQYARSSGHNDLADRLVELQYELTDRLAHYVCGRKPDHATGPHFIIPEMADSFDISEFSKAAKKKLQALPTVLFEELVMDVYDEVDRRHTDDIWQSCQNHSTVAMDRCAVAFLPVNPEYSSTRNQGRQKLGRFNRREFTSLIIDILSEAKHRQHGLSPSATIQKHKANIPYKPPPHANSSILPSKVEGAPVSDDEPLYDSVASDDECGPDQRALMARSLALQERYPNAARFIGDIKGSCTESEYVTLNEHLALAEARIQQLVVNNIDMKKEITDLQTMVQRLLRENNSLRSQVQSVVQSSQGIPNGHERPKTPVSSLDVQEANCAKSPRGSQRPQSMYEPREQQRQQLHDNGNGHGQSGTRRSKDDTHPYLITMRSRELDPCQRPPTPEYDPNSANCYVPPVIQYYTHPPPYGGEVLPSQKEALQKTTCITRHILELQANVREKRHESYVVCAEKIHGAVLELAGIFPQHSLDERVKLALKEMRGSALRLHTETKTLLESRDQTACENQIAEQIMVRHAYDTTKAIKALVMLLE